MKTSLIQSICGALLLGSLAMASAQTSTIVAYTYVGATVQSGGLSAYLGFNPTSGTYLQTATFTDTYVYEASFFGDGRGGAAVTFYATGGSTLSDPMIYAGMDFSGAQIQYLSAGAVIDGSMSLGGSPSLDTLAIGDTGYVGLGLWFGDNYRYGWAEVQRDADQTYTLLATAYNTGAGQSILAGQTVEATPEPSTLVLSAMGGLGVLLLFRNRKCPAV